MTLQPLLLIVLSLCAAFYLFNRQRILAQAGGKLSAIQSRPAHHGWWAGLAAGVPALACLLFWVMFGDRLIDSLTLSSLPADMLPADSLGQRQLVMEIRNYLNDAALRPPSAAILKGAEVFTRYDGLFRIAITALTIGSATIGGLYALSCSTLTFQARARVERVARFALLFSSVIAVLTTLAIILSLLVESLRFFDQVPFAEFFGLSWSPQTALREDQVGASGSFGTIPLFAGTFFISFIAMCVAVPVGLMSAIYLSQYAGARFRKWTKPMLEILAGIPTVVYGFFAALTVAPFIRKAGEAVGLTVASESALAAGLVMGIMIIPFMSSLSEDAISAVPRSLSNGSYALGATKSETITKVLLPAALPGIVGAFLLSISRAIGETMIVVMAAGLAANLTANPLASVTTVTVQIVQLLTGDQEFDSPKTLAAFALGLVLFLMTLGMNAVALFIVRRHRETYE